MQARTWLLTLATVLCLVGCSTSGPQRAAIRGTCSINGEAVKAGRITFVPVMGTSGSSAGEEIKDGTYSIPRDKGPTFGKYRVEIRWSKKTGKQIEMGSPAPPGTKIDEVVEAIPAKYNTESTLEKEVNASQHEFNFDLKS